MIGAVAGRLMARLPAGGFLRHALAISTGVAFAQGITLATGPIISRLYSPAVFGAVATISSIAVVGAIIATLRFEMAIPIATDDHEALALTAIALVFSALSTVSVAIILLVVPASVLVGAGIPEDVSDLRWLIPVLMLASTYQATISQFGTYRRAYGALGTAQALQALASGGIKIGAGLASPGVGGLIGGELVRRFLGIGIVARKSGLRLRELVRHCSVARLRSTAYTYRRYPAFVLPSSVMNTISMQAPIPFLASHFSASEAGFYALGYAAVQTPLAMIQAGVSSAFISRIRAYESAGQLSYVITKMVQSLAVVGAPWFAVCAVWGSEIVALVFGASWREGGTYLSLLSPWLFVNFVFSACGMVLWARNRQGADFRWQVLFVSLRLGALEMGSRSGSAVATVAAYAAVSVVLISSYNWWLLRFVGVGIRGSLFFALRELAAYAVIGYLARYAWREVGVDSPIVEIVAVGTLMGAAGVWRLRSIDAFKLPSKSLRKG